MDSLASSSVTAQILTATATLFIAAATLLGVIPAVIASLVAARRTRESVADVKAVVDGTHTLVNQAHTDLLRYQATLVAAMKLGGLEIPIDQSLPVADTP